MSATLRRLCRLDPGLRETFFSLKTRTTESIAWVNSKPLKSVRNFAFYGGIASPGIAILLESEEFLVYASDNLATGRMTAATSLAVHTGILRVRLLQM